MFFPVLQKKIDKIAIHGKKNLLAIHSSFLYNIVIFVACAEQSLIHNELYRFGIAQALSARNVFTIEHREISSSHLFVVHQHSL